MSATLEYSNYEKGEEVFNNSFEQKSKSRKYKETLDTVLDQIPENNLE
jgi:hypothetical protein